MIRQVAYFVPADDLGLLYVYDEDVCELIASIFRNWCKRNGDNVPHTYIGPAVMVGTFSGTGTESRGFYGTFQHGDRTFTVIDSVVQFHPPDESARETDET